MKNRIRELRTEKNMTQLRLSTELGVSQETVSSYERGRHYPSVSSLMMMASLFDASMDYIMGRSSVRMPTREDSLSGEDYAALSLYRALTKADKQKALAFMQGLLA